MFSCGTGAAEEKEGEIDLGDMKITDNNLHQAIAALRQCAKENEGNVTDTGAIRVSDLCNDVADYLEKSANNGKKVWHSIDEEADSSKFVVLYDVNGDYMSPPSRCMLGFDSDFINAMNKKYGANYTMWAYKDDLAPKKED